jgi:hypothetical protein
VHCLGESPRGPFFAKVLTADAFALREPYLLPPPAGEDDERRSAEDQIETEWRAAERMERVGWGAVLPVRLACSVPLRTLVWRASPGAPLERTMKAHVRQPGVAQGVATALYRVGLWLRSVHDAYSAGRAPLDLAEVRDRLAGVSHAGRPYVRAYAAAAVRCVDRGITILGRRRVEVPLAVTHGDLSPPNILWCDRRGIVTIVDLEYSCTRHVLHDLVLLIANVRSLYLDPFHRDARIARHEARFWDGYGPVAPDLRFVAQTLASVWLFGRFLPSLSDPAKRRPAAKRLLLRGFEMLFEPVLRRKVERALWRATPPSH